MATSQELLKIIENKSKLLPKAKRTERAIEHCRFVIWKDREDYLNNKLKNLIAVK